ncbi:MAG: hypothetical protein EBU66_20595, partial [Bacteroidetes bacterium]|nr:hypothetical protein [bacterium]NBP67032.1 hypothetical protein [Bacteroidota bacterium]
NKITLAVTLGEKASRLLYAVLMILSYASLILLSQIQGNAMYLLPLLLVPFGVYLTKGILVVKKESLNPYVFKTAIHLFMFGLLLCLAMLLSM